MKLLGIGAGRKARHVEETLQPSPPKTPAPAAPIVSVGAVVRDYDVLDRYPAAIRKSVAAISLRPKGGPDSAVLSVIETKNVALTSCYIPIDLDNRFLFVNQSYDGMLHYWNPRPHIGETAYEFRSESPVVIRRKSVVFGGPIDGNYYHWLLNWLGRLATLKMLAPALYHDPELQVLVDVRARASPFIDFLDHSGIELSRFVWVDHAVDYLVEDAVLVSFGSQHENNPEVVKALGDMFRPMGRPPALSGPRKRLWISRQALGAGRRCIANMEEVAPVLAAHGFEEVVLETLSVADQITLFRSAEVVAGVHGSGLANMIFSPPDCRVLVVESDLSLKLNVAKFYAVLAQACGLDYRHLKVKRAPARHADGTRVGFAHNDDLVVPPAALDALLSE